MKVLNKVLTVLLAIALLVPVFAATAEEEMPVITMLVSLDAANPPEDAPIVQAIREASGVDLQPIYVPITEAATKLSARIASGDLPDIFATDTVVATELIGYGALLDMAPYLEEYGQNILADGTARLEFGVNANGSVYALPRQMSYPWCMSVRRDWMRNLGYEVGDESVIEMPIDEFKQLMYDFTHGDPDQDGKDDTFGFCAEDASSGMFAPIFTAYGIPVRGWDSMYYDEETGTCKSIIKHPRFQEALELMQYFYQNGCMDTEFAVVADASTEFAYLWNSTAGAAAWSPVGMTNNWVSRYTEEGVDENSFVYVNITDNDGANGGYIVNYSGWVCVSAACKNPEAAIKLIDFMYSKDGGTMTYLGIEGMHYQWIDQENEKFTLGIKQLVDDPWGHVPATYPVGCTIKGTVTNITDFGLFVEVEEGIEGLVHVSELSSKKVKTPAEIYKEGDQIQAKVIHVSAEERRLGLSIKQIKDEEERRKP